jgi:acetylglutamate kinase
LFKDSFRKTFLIKIGGSVLSNQDSTIEDIVELQKQGHNPIIVHGGGQVISSWMEKLGSKPKFLNGLRITDSDNIDIVTATLAGLVNKNLVASIHKIGGKAIGISGVDGAMLQADILDPDLGYVGRVTKVNAKPIEQIVNSGHIPVIAPLAIHDIDIQNHNNVLLNVNGDTAAGAIAKELSSDAIIFLTDVEGIMDSEKNILTTIESHTISGLIRSGTINGGMVPKVQACIKAIETVGLAQIIDGRKNRALLDFFDGKTTGTRIL